MTQEISYKFSPIKDRILQVIDYKDITVNKFYSETGITRGVLTQNNGISEQNISKFLKTYPEISLDWLLKGEGSMIRTGSVPSRTQGNGQSVSLPVDANVSQLLLQIRDEPDYHKRRDMLDQIQVMYSKLQAEKDEVTADLLDLLKKLKNF